MKFTIALIASVAAFAEASQFKSGAVTGFEKFTYGKFITRMKSPDKKGTVASFFTYWNGPNFYAGGWNELDVEIVPSVSQNPFSMNVIYGDGKTKRETHDYKAGFNPKNDWHIYEMAWTPDFIAWSIDNKEVRRVTKDDPSVKLTDKPQSVMMNFWTPTFESWGKGLDAKDMPWEVEYDYVETYTYNSHTKGFDFHWRDSFNTFDTNRWHKSDNTTFDANSTTFRASQAFIKDGSLILKMEPDHLKDIHGAHRFEPAEVEPVMTEPTPTHGVAKGQKAKKADEHYDVGAEQHYSHMRREGHGFGGEGYMQHGYPGYAPPMYGYGPSPYPAYGYDFGGEMYGQHGDQQAAHVYPSHEYNPAYHHDKPPTTKAEAEAHMGDDAAFFYKEMHNLPKGGAPKGAKANFAAGDHLGDEMTPYEHGHQSHAEHSHESHRGAYSADHDSAHYAAPAYHESAHYAAPAHHGGEWETGHRTGYGVEDGHRYVTEHHPVMGDYDLNEHHGEPHNEHGQDYTHDTDFHDGHALMGQIEHEYDELFHEMEHNTKHGVEHHDVSFVEKTLTDHQRDPQHHVSDFEAVPDHEGHRESHHGGYEGHWTGEAHQGDYSTAHHGQYATAHHGDDWNVEGYHGDYATAHHGDYGYGHEATEGHHGDYNVESHDAWNLEGRHGDFEGHQGDFTTAHHGEYATAHHGDDWNVEGHHGDDHRTDFGHGETAHEPHNEHGQDYTHDTDFHDGHQLMGQIEHEYDELFHEMEHRTTHGVEHHDISFVEKTLTDHEHDPQHHVSDFQAVPDHEGHREAHHGSDGHNEDHWTGEAHGDYSRHGAWNLEGRHGDFEGHQGDFTTAHHGDYATAHHGDYATAHHGDYATARHGEWSEEGHHGDFSGDWSHEAPVHMDVTKQHEQPLHEAPKHQKKAASDVKKAEKSATEEKPAAKETKQVGQKLQYHEVPTGHDFVHRMLSQ